MHLALFVTEESAHAVQCGYEYTIIITLVLFSLLSCSVPSVPQNVSAVRTGPTSVLVTWMEPVVLFREHMHNCSTVTACVNDMQQHSYMYDIMPCCQLGC